MVASTNLETLGNKIFILDSLEIIFHKWFNSSRVEYMVAFKC